MWLKEALNKCIMCGACSEASLLGRLFATLKDRILKFLSNIPILLNKQLTPSLGSI
ncbi:MAG: hypothetical protein OFPII_21640 [Osedax symbiont Rs1]|nr:MAG: hypothetical protein OFPII_21640 [Osedax symbiont Rs1]